MLFIGAPTLLGFGIGAVAQRAMRRRGPEARQRLVRIYFRTSLICGGLGLLGLIVLIVLVATGYKG